MAKKITIVVLMLCFLIPQVVSASGNQNNNSVVGSQEDISLPGLQSELNRLEREYLLEDEFYADGSLVRVYEIVGEEEKYFIFIDLMESIIPHIEKIGDEREQVKEATRLLAYYYYHNDAILDLNILFQKESEYLFGTYDQVKNEYKNNYYENVEYAVNQIEVDPGIELGKEEEAFLNLANSDEVLNYFDLEFEDKTSLIENMNEEVDQLQSQSNWFIITLAGIIIFVTITILIFKNRR